MTVVKIGPDAGKAVLGALRRNQIVCLLSDRDLTGDGVEVEFFGERTRLPGGPATVALRTGAPLLPVAVYFEERGGHHGVVQPPVPAERQGRLRDDVQRVTQELARRFEQLISTAPEQWHLLQPNWPSDLAGTDDGGRG
jgi:KDO2-lipid IV(A) lauroyltransferase